MSETLLTVDEAAQRLRIKPATLRSQLRAGRVRAVRTGKMWRIPESALEPIPLAGKLDESATLFAPPTADEIARQLEALDALIADAPPHRANASELDLSGDRGELYGYSERENRQG